MRAHLSLMMTLFVAASMAAAADSGPAAAGGGAGAGGAAAPAVGNVAVIGANSAPAGGQSGGLLTGLHSNNNDVNVDNVNNNNVIANNINNINNNDNNILNSSSSSSSVSMVNSINSNRRLAYVTIHYEGTPGDAQYVLGIRVLLKSLQPLRHPFIILASDTVTQKSRDLFTAEGATVVPIPNIENPFSHVLARFQYTFNKLHLWNLVEFDRLIYFDADNIAVHLDLVEELFLCGHFCVVFMNPCHFHTGVMVIKPNHTMYETMRTQLQDTGSYDGAHQGFLSAFFNKHSWCADAPLFNPSKGVSEDPINVLHIAYNYHSLYYLVNPDMEAFRCGSFATVPDYLPVATLGYPVPTIIKPWNWWCFLVGHTFEWNEIRNTLAEPDLHHQILLRVLMVLFVYALASYALNRHCLSESSFTLLTPKLRYMGATVTGVVLGLACFLIANRVGAAMTPPYARTLHGALLYSLTHFAVFHVLARVASHELLHFHGSSWSPSLFECRFQFMSMLMLFALNHWRPLLVPLLGPGLPMVIVTALIALVFFVSSHIQTFIHLAVASPVFGGAI